MAKKRKTARRTVSHADHSPRKPDFVKDNATTIIVVLGLLLLFSVGYDMKISNQVTELAESLSGGSAPTPTQAAPAPAPSPQPQVAPVVDVSADDDPVKGKANAPVEMIEFSDFQCPFCARWYRDTLPQIQKEYIDTGKVKLVFRDYPLSFHPQAQKGSEAAECADDQGKFWEYHDKIFENQGAMSIDSFKAWAGELGLNQKEFDSCLDSGKHAAEVQKDFADGQAAGVSGTPSFFINGKKLVGAHPFATFKQVLDAELQ